MDTDNVQQCAWCKTKLMQSVEEWGGKHMHSVQVCECASEGQNICMPLMSTLHWIRPKRSTSPVPIAPLSSHPHPTPTTPILLKPKQEWTIIRINDNAKMFWSLSKRSLFSEKRKTGKIMWCLPKLFPLLPVFPVEGPKGAIAWISAAEKRRQHCTTTTTILILATFWFGGFFLRSLFFRVIVLSPSNVFYL